ncbi:MAG: hypothetical protein Q9159_007554 [Coniocarpon cinnabarinum]
MTSKSPSVSSRSYSPSRAHPPDDDRSAEQAAYEYLVNVLNASWHGHLEVEVLSPDLHPDQFAIRIIENAVGIPQTLLLLAFQYARLLFLSGLPQARSHGLDRWDDFQHTMSCTQIILLFDPTHVTAANTRKRLLRWLFDPSFSPAGSVIDEIIRKELWLLDSLQTSPLPKHTKSSVLWQHRRWLLDEFLEWVMDVQRADVLGSKRMSILLAPNDTFGGNPIDPTEIFWRSLIEPELKVIATSGERHRLNYHGWDFARRLIEVMIDYSDENDLDLPRLMSTSVDLVQDWCLSHLSDTSGWTFFLWLVGQTRDENLMTRCFVSVGNLVVSYRYRQEPVWIFIRTILASEDFLSAEFRATFVGELSGWLEQELEIKKKIEGERAQAWQERHDDAGLRLQEMPYFDLVMGHLKWIKHRWQGRVRPALFDPPPDQHTTRV